MNGRRRGRPSKYDGPAPVVDIKPRRVERVGKYKVPDGPIDRPPRPCGKCGHEFQPTIKRRLLCEGCFYFAEDPLHEHPLSA